MSRTGSESLDRVLGFSDKPASTGSDPLDKALGIGSYMPKYVPTKFDFEEAAAQGAPQAQNAAPIQPGARTDNLLQAKDFFMKQGMPEHVAAGIVGNIMQESGGDPSAQNKSGAFGLAQFMGDRKKSLFNYAESKGVPPTDASTQLEFMMQEMRGGDAGAARALKGMMHSKTAGEAAQIFSKDYERPGESEANVPRRMAGAEQFMRGQMPGSEVEQTSPFIQSAEEAQAAQKQAFMQQQPAPPVPQQTPVNPEAAPGTAPVMTPEGPKAPEPPRFQQNAYPLQDVGTSAMKGGVGLMQSVVGAIDTLSPGQFGKWVENNFGSMDKLQQDLNAQYSPEQLAENKALTEAHGWDILPALIQHPRAAGAMLMESAPQTVGGGVIGMGLKGLGAGTTLASMAGEALLGTGSATEQGRIKDPNRELTTPTQLAALGTGITTGAISGLGGAAVTKAGGFDPTRMIAELGGKKAVNEAVKVAAKNPSVVKSVFTSIAGEMGEEAAQSATEQIWQNIKDDKPWDEGIKDPAILGSVLGGLMGGGAGFAGNAGALRQPTQAAPIPEQAITPDVVPPEVVTPEVVASAPAQTTAPQTQTEMGGEAYDRAKVLADISAENDAVAGIPSELPPSETAQAEQAEQAAPSVGTWRTAFENASDDVFKQNSILRAIADVSKNASELDDVVNLLGKLKKDHGLEVASTAYAVLENKYSSKEAKQKSDALSEHMRPALPEINGAAIAEHIGVDPKKPAFKRLSNIDTSTPEGIDALQTELNKIHKSSNKPEQRAAIEKVDTHIENLKLAEQEQINASQIPSTEEVIPSGGAQPSILEEGQGPPISSEGVPVSNAEISQVAQEAVTEPVIRQGEEGKTTAEEGAGVTEAVEAPIEAEGPVDTTHEDQRIYENTYKEGKRFLVETQENKNRRLAGDRNRGGDAIFDTLEEAKNYAAQQKAQYEQVGVYEAEQKKEDALKEKQKELRDATDGFADQYTPVQRGAIIKNLDKKVSIKGKGDSIKNHVKSLVEAGELPNTYTEDKVKPVSRTQFNRMDSAQQQAHERKIKEAGEKTIYNVGGYNLGKTAYDYANHLLSLKQESEIAEQGGQSYSVAKETESTGHTAESLKTTLSPEMKRLVASGKAVIHDTVETLPEGDHPDNVQGMTTKEGVAHFVADKLTPESLQNVALHEIGVHAGMENLVGPDIYKDLTNQAMTNVGPAFDKARASIPKDTPAHLRHHEALAYLVEHAPNLPIVKRMVSAIRNFARTKLGMKVQLTEADARHLAIKALRRESKTTVRTARKEGTAYSTKKSSPDWDNLVNEAENRVDDAGNTKQLTSAEKITPWKEDVKNILKDGFDWFKPAKFRAVGIDKNDPLVRIFSALDTVADLPILDRNEKPLKWADGSPMTAKSIRADVIKYQADQGLSLATNVNKLGRATFNSVNDVVIKTIDDANGKPMEIGGKPLSLDNLLEFIGAKDKEIKGFSQVFSDVMRINVGEARLKTVDKAALAALKRAIGLKTSAINTAPDAQTKAKLTRERGDLESALSEMTPEQMVSQKDIAWRDKVMADPTFAGDLDNAIKSTRAVLNSYVQFEKEAGLLTDKQAAEFMEEGAAYVPIFKSLTDLEEIYGDTTQQGGKGKGATQARKIQKSAQTVNIIENLKRRAHQAVVSGIINNSKSRAVEQIVIVKSDEALPVSKALESRLSTAEKARILRFKRDGVERIYLINDPQLLETLSFAGPLMHPIGNLLTKGSDLIRTTALRTPSFFLRQLPGEIVSAALFSGTQHGGITGVPHLIKSIGKSLINRNESAKTLESYGMVVGIHDFIDKLSHSYEAFNKPKSILNPTRFKESKSKILQAIGKTAEVAAKPLGLLNKLLQHVGAGIDAGVRAHVFEMAVKDAKKMGLNDDESASYAINKARQFINFTASGSSDMMSIYRKAYLFSGASINSLDAVMKNATGYGLSKKEAKIARKMFYTRAFTLGAMTMGMTLFQMYNDPESYDKFMEDEANANKIKLWDFGDGTYLTMTMPFEANFLVHTLPSLLTQGIFHAFNDKMGLSVKEIMKRFRAQLAATIIPPSPVNIDAFDTWNVSLNAPSGMAPVVEAAFNYSSHRGTAIESSAAKRLPEEFREAKSPMVSFFTDTLNSMTGDRGPKISPILVEQIARGYLTDYLTTANAIVDKGIRAVHPEKGLPQSTVEKYPFLRSVITNPNKIIKLGDALDLAEEVSQQAAQAAKLESGEAKGSKEFFASPYHKITAGFAEDILKSRNELGSLNKELKTIENSNRSPADKIEVAHRIRVAQQKNVNTILATGKKMDARITEAEKLNSEKPQLK